MESVAAEASGEGADEQAQATVAEVRDGQPLVMWEVWQGERLQAYLHGSVHVLPGAHIGQEPHVDQAYVDSDALVVEVDISTSQAGLSLLTAQLGMYPRGESLEDHLDEELLTQVREEVAKYDVPLAAAMRMRPWLLAVTLSMLSMTQEGFSQEYGVDRRFLAEAHGRGDDGKPVFALETAEGQLRLFADLPEQQQVLFLKDVLMRAGSNDELRRMLEAWAAGDVQALEELLFAPLQQDPSLLPFYDTFFFQRNRAMAARLTELFANPMVYFVVVGTAHLVGEQSLVSLLAERGFAVEQVYVTTEDDGTGATAEPELDPEALDELEWDGEPASAATAPTTP